ncbi:MAG: glycosyltransferase, partial [Thiovulaceae bacterium]|nr:glycosyltransferase [Sulfurimonadaceae bacterium]
MLGDQRNLMMVSIIIPTFNRLELLKRAIASAQDQTYKDYELIIIDDASTDGTKEYLQTLPHKIITLKRNEGVSASRNAGIKASIGRFIAFLDSDDSWDSQKLEHQVAYHLANSEVRFSFGSERWVRLGKEVSVPAKYSQPLKADFHELLEFTYIGPSSVMLEKSLFNEVG